MGENFINGDQSNGNKQQEPSWWKSIIEEEKWKDPQCPKEQVQFVTNLKSIFSNIEFSKGIIQVNRKLFDLKEKLKIKIYVSSIEQVTNKDNQLVYLKEQVTIDRQEFINLVFPIYQEYVQNILQELAFAENNEQIEKALKQSTKKIRNEGLQDEDAPPERKFLSEIQKVLAKMISISKDKGWLKI